MLELCFGSNDPAKTIGALLLCTAKVKVLHFSNGNTPLYCAVAMDNDELCDTLLRHNFDPNHGNIDSLERPLHLAAKLGKPTHVRRLIENGAHVELCNDTGDTALALACSHGHVSTVSLLLSEGANVKFVSEKTGHTPLHIAAHNSKKFGIEMIRLLICFGANVNARSMNGFTPLHVAACAGSVDGCKLLLEVGADLALLSSKGLSILNVASGTEVKALLEDVERAQRAKLSAQFPSIRARHHSAPPAPAPDLSEPVISSVVKSRSRILRDRSISSPFSIIQNQMSRNP